jgi:hypothetical protein
MTSLTSLDASAINRPATYDLNARQYGPVVATAIGAADALGSAVSATYEFSKEGLEELAQAGEDAFHAVTGALGQAEQAVEDVAQDIGDELGAAASAAGSALSSVADGVSNLAGSIASYVGLGVSAASQALSEVA